MEDIPWAARLYGAYPEVKGAAIWNLGRLDNLLLPLNTQVQGLVDNLLALSLDSYFTAPPRRRGRLWMRGCFRRRANVGLFQSRAKSKRTRSTPRTDAEHTEKRGVYFLRALRVLRHWKSPGANNNR